MDRGHSKRGLLVIGILALCALGGARFIAHARPPAQSPATDSELNLNGAIDFHVHQGPDSVDRVIDADDLARLAKKMGMRGMVMKNHWEGTAGLVYIVRKEVPGIELFGGITQDLAVGGINLEAVKHMAAMEGGRNDVKYGQRAGPFVRVSENGHLYPAC